MQLDAQLQFSAAQALSATADATNVVDLGVAREIGDGRRLSLYIHVSVAADTASANETYAVSITTDDNASLTSDAVVVGPIDLPRALLTANSLHEIPLPAKGLAAFERYMGVVYTLGGTTPSVTLSAWLAPSGSLPSVKTYPNGWDN